MNNSPDEVGFAGRVRSALDQGTANLDNRISVRLYEARCDALRHQAVPVTAASLASIGHVLAGTFHHHYRGVLALVALAVGALAVQLWQNAQEAAELAEIDSALLSDEVPPSAYTDQGFMVWLHRVSGSEDESLPE